MFASILIWWAKKDCICRQSINQLSELPHSVEKRSPGPMHNTYAGFGHHYMPFKYGSGFYTPSLAKHNYKYDERYVAGYGPRAYNFMYRGY